MAKREVIEVTCDRCEKTETQNKDSVRADDAPPEFTFEFGGSKKVYEDLCRNCRKACQNYFNKATKVDEPKDSKPVAAPSKPSLEPDKANPSKKSFIGRALG